MKRRNFLAATAATTASILTGSVIAQPKLWEKDPINMIWAHKYKRWCPEHKIIFNDFEPVDLTEVGEEFNYCKLVKIERNGNYSTYLYYRDFFFVIPMYKSNDEYLDVVETVKAYCEDTGSPLPPTILSFKYGEFFGACAL